MFCPYPVKHIGYELSLILRLRQISYGELENKLFDDKNSKTPVSVEDLKIILLSDPFELTDSNNALLAARYLFDSEDADVNKARELGLLKGNFRKLIGKYSLITEEIEKDLFDYIAQSIAKYEESLRAHFSSLPNLKDDGIISYVQLMEGFRALDIEIHDKQLDYLILRLYDLSHNLQELDYSKMFDIFQTEENIRLKQIFEMYNENLNDLHQIRETDSDDRDKLKSKMQSTDNRTPKPEQIDDDEEYMDDYEFDHKISHSKNLKTSLRSRIKRLKLTI